MLRFGWFYGSGATHSKQFLAFARRHVCIQMGRAGGYVSSISTWPTASRRCRLRRERSTSSTTDP
ncbi:MAG: hypothetical protein AVDCRST_MAG77-4889 [uncultured Chloroflexi bacterium]|uniref:Uncharacterized protein n=1 Tax=uncultured Chloroflexota bacterium TaxID=166587 RepID=A0A6J4K276_9CHLR|nr:MAG: hypothetical protein AVDCRST_MAG77-4889 [uncultured Chloroflexota bacterium]